MESYLPTPATLAKALPTMSAAALKEWAPELTSRPQAQPEPEPEPEPAAHCHAGGSEPKVELVRTEGRVTKVIVTCRCGERMALDCLYEA
jgi:hypothetical protein